MEPECSDSDSERIGGRLVRAGRAVTHVALNPRRAEEGRRKPAVRMRGPEIQYAYPVSARSADADEIRPWLSAEFRFTLECANRGAQLAVHRVHADARGYVYVPNSENDRDFVIHFTRFLPLNRMGKPLAVPPGTSRLRFVIEAKVSRESLRSGRVSTDRAPPLREADDAWFTVAEGSLLPSKDFRPLFPDHPDPVVGEFAVLSARGRNVFGPEVQYDRDSSEDSWYAVVPVLRLGNAVLPVWDLVSAYAVSDDYVKSESVDEVLDAQVGAVTEQFREHLIRTARLPNSWFAHAVPLYERDKPLIVAERMRRASAGAAKDGSEEDGGRSRSTSTDRGNVNGPAGIIQTFTNWIRGSSPPIRGPAPVGARFEAYRAVRRGWRAAFLPRPAEARTRVYLNPSSGIVCTDDPCELVVRVAPAGRRMEGDAAAYEWVYPAEWFDLDGDGVAVRPKLKARRSKKDGSAAYPWSAHASMSVRVIVRTRRGRVVLQHNAPDERLDPMTHMLGGRRESVTGLCDVEDPEGEGGVDRWLYEVPAAIERGAAPGTARPDRFRPDASRILVFCPYGSDDVRLEWLRIFRGLRREASGEKDARPDDA